MVSRGMSPRRPTPPRGTQHQLLLSWSWGAAPILDENLGGVNEKPEAEFPVQTLIIPNTWTFLAAEHLSAPSLGTPTREAVALGQLPGHPDPWRQAPLWVALSS